MAKNQYLEHVREGVQEALDRASVALEGAFDKYAEAVEAMVDPLSDVFDRLGLEIQYDTAALAICLAIPAAVGGVAGYIAGRLHGRRFA